MNKQEFLTALRQGLSGLPIEDTEERLNFYSEMIDDQVEEGKSEEEAVASIGSVDEILSQILSEVPLTQIVKKKIKPKRRLRTWEIVLLAVGSPLWLSLGVSAFAVLISVYAVLWCMVATAWSVFGSLVGCAAGGIGAGVICFCMGNPSAGLLWIFGALVLAGLSIFGFFGCREATVGTARLTKLILLGIKKIFIVKGEEV